MKIYRILNAILLIMLVAFVTHKLLKVIAWSWWWVLAPAWVSIVVIVLLGIFVVYTLRNEKLDVSEYDNI